MHRASREALDSQRKPLTAGTAGTAVGIAVADRRRIDVAVAVAVADRRRIVADRRPVAADTWLLAGLGDIDARNARCTGRECEANISASATICAMQDREEITCCCWWNAAW